MSNESTIKVSTMARTSSRTCHLSFISGWRAAWLCDRHSSQPRWLSGCKADTPHVDAGCPPNQPRSDCRSVPQLVACRQRSLPSMRAITSSSVDISPKSLVRCATATARTWPRIQPPFSRFFRRLPRALQSHTCRDAAAARSPVGLGANLSRRASFRLLATWRRPPSSARAQQGLGFEPDAKGRFKTDEDDARAGHFGLWKGCFAGPRDFRRWNKRSAKLLGASPPDARDKLFPDEANDASALSRRTTPFALGHPRTSITCPAAVAMDARRAKRWFGVVCCRDPVLLCAQLRGVEGRGHPADRLRRSKRRPLRPPLSHGRWGWPLQGSEEAAHRQTS